MSKGLFLEMEHEFRKAVGLGYDDRMSLNEIADSDTLRGGKAYRGLVAAIAPLRIKAKKVGDEFTVNQIDDALERYKVLNELESYTDDYNELSEQMLKEYQVIAGRL